MTLGILGGMSWTSTAAYYRHINLGISQAKGKQHSADLLLSSIDFQTIIDLQVKNKWDEAGKILNERARKLEQSGANAILVASNTMHKVLNHIEKDLSVPILNIFDATSAAIAEAGVSKVGLLGTRYTMSDRFFISEYQRRGITVISPEPQDFKIINEMIFRELIHGAVSERATKDLVAIAHRLSERGCEGVILGCTELSLLEPQKSGVRFFDTTLLHCRMAVRWLLDQPY